LIGQTVSHYRITSLLGVGGMGEVYLAEDTQLHCQRALKFLPATVTKDSPDHTRLVNEARALAALEHPNICPVQEIGDHEGQTFIVMSYLEGQTLKDRLAAGPVSQVEALEITRQILAALTAAHARGIVHRDVKPDNVMLLKDGDRTESSTRVMLMDFGIAKKHDSTLVTRTGTVMGTAAYMSPEQANGEKVDTASDVWATGVILYEMLAGERPFQADLEPALLYAIVNSDPEPLTGPGKMVPEPVEQVVGKALAKDRKNRYADAEAMLADLDLAAEGLTVRGRRLIRRRRGPWIGAAVGTISLLLLALFVWPGFLTTEDAISVLAVMPLEDRGGDPDQAYFAEGVADEVASGLRKIGALTIVSRNSAARAREIYETNQEIGERLGVQALVEGSIQREGERIKVSVQLVATDDDRLLWSDSYTREIKDILNLQSEIALAVSTALEAELTTGEQEILTTDRQIDPGAWEEILIGRHLHSQVSGESTAQAIRHFKRALEIQPDLVEVHADLAFAYHLNGQMAGLSTSEVEEKVRYHNRRAQELDPNSFDSQATAALVAGRYDWDLTQAVEHWARAAELDPSQGLMGYAQELNILGRHQDALEVGIHAGRVEPLNPFVQANLAGRYLRAGQPEAALQVIERMQAWAPDFWISLWVLGQLYVMEGNLGAAIEVAEKAVANPDSGDEVKSLLAYALYQDGRREDATAILEEFEARADTSYVPHFHLAATYNALGRIEEAFAAYELSLAERDWRILWIKDASWGLINPELRSDPRWPDLIRRIGLPPD
jgi:serine/threonine protein kinase/Flp pilus assembly protein TadD